jgi:hypothetical protein
LAVDVFGQERGSRLLHGQAAQTIHPHQPDPAAISVAVSNWSAGSQAGTMWDNGRTSCATDAMANLLPHEKCATGIGIWSNCGCRYRRIHRLCPEPFLGEEPVSRGKEESRMEQPQLGSRAGTSVTQLLITLDNANLEVARVELLDKAGRKREASADDFAGLVGDHDVEDLLPVLEQAYMAGFADASSDVVGSADDRSHGESGEDDLEQAVIRGVASRRMIRRSVRSLVLARLLKRELQRRRAPSPTAPASETSH